MSLNRREMLATCAAGLPALVVSASEAVAAAGRERKRLGIVIYSYGIRTAVERTNGSVGLSDPLHFLEHCHHLGAGGVQLGIGTRDKSYTAKLREKLDGYQMFLEGSIRLPKDQADVERFAGEVRTAKDAGAKVLRTVMLSGRRYEVFDSAAALAQAADRAYVSLCLAESVVAKQDMRLAVENHKDWRTVELVALLKRLDSQHVGACVDTGNSIALLEDPLEVVEALAPFAFSVHLKDMAVAEYEEGFLLAEVPLGDGMLDVKKIVKTLREARPEICFGLEMITRDPLRVPCLTPKYWATLEALPGQHLARTLALVRKQGAGKSLPRISELPREQQLRVEEDNVQRSLDYARRHLEL